MAFDEKESKGGCIKIPGSWQLLKMKHPWGNVNVKTRAITGIYALPPEIQK